MAVLCTAQQPPVAREHAFASSRVAKTPGRATAPGAKEATSRCGGRPSLDLPGYSVTLLDRAVERGLQVIQSTVDHVAATPRHLLSSEVMTLLERQVPQTAGAVRGLARWSVQQRLEHQLGETVGYVVQTLNICWKISTVPSRCCVD